MKQVQQDGVNKLEGFCNVQNVRSPRQLFLILFSQLWTVEVTTLMPESFRSTFGVFTASVKPRSAVCDKEFRDFQLLDRRRLSPEKKSTRAPLESSHVTPRRLRSHVFRNKRESKTPCCLGPSSRVFQPSQFQKSLWKPPHRLF